MRLRIEAEPNELEEKSESLVEAIVDIISPFNAELAHNLEKALDKKESADFQPKVIKDIREITSREYKKQLKLMLKDIDKVLDKALVKADGEEEDEDKPEPGDIDVETGKLIPEKDEDEDTDTEEDQV